MYVALGIIITVILVLIDQVAKLVAVKKLEDISTIEVINGFMNLTFVKNTGAAFGILEGARWFFVVGTFIVIGCIAYYYVKLPRTKDYSWVRVSLVLISAGALGNFIDRVTRGYVIDFFHVIFIEFPVFNIADIYVVVGTFLLAILMLFVIKDEKKEEIVEEEGALSE